MSPLQSTSPVLAPRPDEPAGPGRARPASRGLEPGTGRRPQPGTGTGTGRPDHAPGGRPEAAGAVAAGHLHESAGHDCAGCLDRRQVLVRAGAVAAGVAVVGVLAACGSSGSPTGPVATPGADGSLASVADIPVGGALSANDADGKPILLTQPEAGTVVGLSAVCTHQGCTVLPDDSRHRLLCPCHGSTYDLQGTNTGGPAPSPLPPFDVHVTNGAVFAGKA